MTPRTARTATRRPTERRHLRVGDAEERAEEQAGEAVQEPAVEADEQRAAGQREGLHGTDDRRLVAEGLTAVERGTRAMTSAAAIAAPKYPIDALTPSRIAPAAPGNETTAKVWPAKLWRRSTMNHPMAPAATATIVPACSALTMKCWPRQLADVAPDVPAQPGRPATGEAQSGHRR